MKQAVYILIFLLLNIFIAEAQRSGSTSQRGGFSLSNLYGTQSEIPDSLLLADTLATGSNRIGYRITPLLGDAYVAPLDTQRLNYGNSTLMESRSLAIGYLGNVGSPAQTKIFSERKEARDFIFADPYDYFITTPENALFYDTKVPYTQVMYTRAGSKDKMEEQLKGTLTLNFGKRINVGADLDYIYGRGHYNSNGNKLLTYRFFGSYHSDRYEAKAYIMNFNFVNHENGGLTLDDQITNPDNYTSGNRVTDSKAFETRFGNVNNRVRGKQFFLTHRYNLGFERTLETITDSEGNDSTVFVPVSSIIHTITYKDNRRHFNAIGKLDSAYQDRAELYESPDSAVSNRPSAWNFQNTIGLSLREGFQDWAKFGITAFVHFEKRQFKMPALNRDSINRYQEGMVDKDGKPITKQDWINPDQYDQYDEFSTYLGAEISKRRGSILTYNARGELCILGDDIGEFRIKGELQTRFPLFGKEAAITAEGYIRNVTPAFFLRHNHSRYFIWDNTNFNNEQQFYVGGKVNLESTRTQLSAGVNSIQNYVYVGSQGLPIQHGSNVQVVTARIKQDFRFRAFNWENEAAYQLSSNKDVLPLPELSVYSNLYFAFKLARVLTVQLGADVHYHTKYNAPYYEPATQLFQVQNEVKVGGYPLMNLYANLHLKQARFFVMAYNLGSQFVDPNYFSLAHYPLNPMVVKFGISVMFNN